VISENVMHAAMPAALVPLSSALDVQRGASSDNVKQSRSKVKKHSAQRGSGSNSNIGPSPQSSGRVGSKVEGAEASQDLDQKKVHATDRMSQHLAQCVQFCDRLRNSNEQDNFHAVVDKV